MRAGGPCPDGLAYDIESHEVGPYRREAAPYVEEMRRVLEGGEPAPEHVPALLDIHRRLHRLMVRLRPCETLYMEI